jgi:hypothetical protein
MANFRIWRFFQQPARRSDPRPVPPKTGFREGDTFVPERILGMDESLAVLHATSQALACCALAQYRKKRGDSDTVPVEIPRSS